MYDFLEEYGNVVAAVIVCTVGGFVLHSLSVWIKLMENVMVNNLI